MIMDRDHLKGMRASDFGSLVTQHIILYLVAILTAVPLFIILLPHLPEIVLPLGGGIRIDHTLTFVVVVLAMLVLVHRLRETVVVLTLMGALALTTTSVLGTYTVGDLYRGYADMLERLRSTSEQVPMASARYRPFRDADKLRALIVGTQPDVRKAAVRLATTHFTEVQVGPDEFTLVQSLSIFKVINKGWTYVSDVKGAEYFAPPAESLELMAGDCDDHAVLMAALIKSIGGQVRLVRTEGHVYPELRVGNDRQMERAAYLIRKVLFVREVGDAPLYHHTDTDGVHWINLDYTRNYPGGELMNERILGVLEV